MKSSTGLAKILWALALLLTALGVRAQNSVVGGDLFVAQNGTIGATLLGANANQQGFFFLELLYPSGPGREDVGITQVFNNNTAVGTTVQLQPSIPINGQQLNFFPQGTPVMLSLFTGDQTKITTGEIPRSFPGVISPTAVVTYGSNNSAIVDFGGLFDVRVGLTNVFGSFGNGSGCRG
jgi:hypothetical protein